MRLGDAYLSETFIAVRVAWRRGRREPCSGVPPRAVPSVTLHQHGPRTGGEQSVLCRGFPWKWRRYWASDVQVRLPRSLSLSQADRVVNLNGCSSCRNCYAGVHIGAHKNDSGFR